MGFSYAVMENNNNTESKRLSLLPNQLYLHPANADIKYTFAKNLAAFQFFQIRCCEYIYTMNLDKTNEIKNQGNASDHLAK